MTVARRSFLSRALALAALILTAGSVAASSAAHQQKEAITRVLFNPRTGHIEVMHRFLLHDAEHATRTLFGGEADLLGSAEARDRFEGYAHGRFSLEAQDGVAIELTPVGHEVEGRYLWVYAEAPIPEGLAALTITHGALRDVWPDQVNLVNVERGKKVQSATFGRGVDKVTVEF